MKLELWLAWKLLMTKQVMKTSSHLFAFLGLVLGVAILVASMAVMSGFETSLKNAIADVTGHVQVIKKPYIHDTPEELTQKVKQSYQDIESSQPFALVEGVLPWQGKIMGVLVQGVDAKIFQQVLNLQSRLVQGSLDLHDNKIFIGQGIAKSLKLKIDDAIRIVIPVADGSDGSRFQRHIGEFKIGAIMDFGKNEWNNRYIISDLTALQAAAKIDNRYTGLLLKIKDIDQARPAAFLLTNNLGPGYWAKDWRELNENLLQAVAIERVVIFFVVLIIVIVAAFNIASSLYVNVLQRFTDIAILKSLGLSTSSMWRIFCFQGIFVALLGLFLGINLGLLLSVLFEVLQQVFQVMDGSVYKLDSISADVRLLDIVAVSFATIFICLVATILPARRGAKLSPVEGLRYG